MRRPLAACIALVMLWALGRPATTHVHAYDGREPVHHDHGVAAQDHGHRHAGSSQHHHHRRTSTSGRRYAAARLSSPHRNGHTIFLRVATTAARAAFTLPFEAVEGHVVRIAPPRGGVACSVEARQHSPPAAAPVPPRAPPCSTLA